MNEIGNIELVRNIERHIKGNVVSYKLYKAKNDCVVVEIDRRNVFPVTLKKGDFLYLYNRTETDFKPLVEKKDGFTFHETVFDGRDEYLVAYQGVFSAPNQGIIPKEIVSSEIMKRNNFPNMREQIKEWMSILEYRYPNIKITNILAFSKY